MPYPAARLLAIALLAALVPDPLPAQACTAFPSLRDRPVRIAGSAVTHRYATALGFSVAAGKDVFATLAAGRTRDGELDATTLDIGLEGGADIPLGSARRDYFCPLAALSLALGPNEFLLADENRRSIEAALGLGLAWIPVKARRLAVILAGGFRVARITVTHIPGAASRAYTESRSRSDVYWLFSLGAGFVLGDVLTIRPGVTVPFGLAERALSDLDVTPFGREEQELSLGLAVGVSFGRRARAPRQ